MWAESVIALCEHDNKCEHCDREIKKGQHYCHTSGIDDDGEYYTLMLCRDCGKLFSYVAGETCGIVDSDDVNDFVIDNVCSECRLFYSDCQKRLCARIVRFVNER